MLAKKITIFLSAGLPKGTREVKIDQWSGKGICVPRNALTDIVSLPEVEQGACVYFLIGSPDEGGLLDVYVGEADGFKARIKNHDYSKEWWQDVVVFISQDRSLTKAGIQYLESICIARLKMAGRCNLKNMNNPSLPSVPKEDISGLEIFYDNLSIIMPLLGYDIFISNNASSIKQISDRPLFICKKGEDISAQAYLLEDGKMQVIKSSKAVAEETPSFQTHPYKKLRDKLLTMKRLVKVNQALEFTDDYVFDSPSAACGIVLGRSASGPLEWRLKDTGQSLKDYLNAKLEG